jgi:hypothetical protein
MLITNIHKHKLSQRSDTHFYFKYSCRMLRQKTNLGSVSVIQNNFGVPVLLG